MNGRTLQQRIEAANKEGRLARIPFITAGFPDKAAFFTHLCELDNGGADIIEVGVPFSDPVADGPVVEEASRRVLETGLSLEWILDALQGLNPRLRAGLVLMGYYNPFLQYGLRRFAADAATAGVQGLIVPDLPLDEAVAFKEVLDAAGIDLITLVGPNTSDERMRAYAAKATGFVYVVSVMGTTGARAGLPPEAAETVARARKIFSLPVALGFGIQSPEQLQGMQTSPDAVVFGSALLRHIEATGEAASFMARWK